MTTYGAYDRGLPCKNPNCNSHGKPHPNCRCYGDFAEGGEASFCSEARMHNPDCEYFADGGDVVPADDVPADDLPETPDANVVPESDLPETAPEVPLDSGIVPADDLPTAPEPTGKIAPEAWSQMNSDYEKAAGIGSLITGGGVVGAAGKAAAAVAEYANLGKIGSGVLQGAISNGLITGSDELSQAMLGQNPEHPVASILASAGLGALFGGAGAGASQLAKKKLERMTEGKLGDKLTSWLAGFGSAANPANEKMAGVAKEMSGIQGFSKKAFDEGGKAFNKILAKGVGPAAAAAYGYGSEKDEDEKLMGALKYGIGAYGLGKFGKLAGKAATPVVLKILSSGTTLGLLDALSHADKVAKGISKVDKAVEGLFSASAKAGAFAAEDPKKIEDWLQEGGIDHDVQQEIYDQNAPEPQGFAEGGEVSAPIKEPNGVELHFPEQNMLMQAAKARASNYLNSLRPGKHAPKLAFDDEPDDRQQKKAYKRAVAVAASPLRVLDDIKRGTIEADDIKHLNAMFPEVTSLLQKKITERIAKAQMGGKKPSFKVRQGLSMLMGTALSGEFTPEAIQAAQAVFAKQGGQPQQPQQAASPKKNTSKLSKSSQAYLTDDQARAGRQQKP